jgi:hypothetical protein
VEFLYLVLTGNCLSIYFYRLVVFGILVKIVVLLDNLHSCIKAMIIVAWNGTGQPSSIFDPHVFKKVLSIFITAAILKLGQGELK